MNQIKIGLLIAGVKGLNFLKALSLSNDEKIHFVSSYPFKGLQCQPMDEIIAHCKEKNYVYLDSKALNHDCLNQADIFFIAGWQFLTDLEDNKCIVFHDSLLPKFRGFAPTVNALICGEKNIGVTAFKPTALADAGSIYEQTILPVKYPSKIKEIYTQLGGCYAECANNILKKLHTRTLTATPQDESKATYSLWRDDSDRIIDWNQDADTICRFVDALGWPYLGARTFYMKREIIVLEAEKVLPEKHFHYAQPGKIWSIHHNQPEVVCKKGTVRILHAQHLDGQNVFFDKLREYLSN